MGKVKLTYKIKTITDVIRVTRAIVWALRINTRDIRMAFFYFNCMSFAAFRNIWKKQTYKQRKQNKTKTGGQTRKWNNTICFEKWEISHMKNLMLLNQLKDSSHSCIEIRDYFCHIFHDSKPTLLKKFCLESKSAQPSISLKCETYKLRFFGTWNCYCKRYEWEKGEIKLKIKILPDRLNEEIKDPMVEQTRNLQNLVSFWKLPLQIRNFYLSSTFEPL